MPKTLEILDIYIGLLLADGNNQSMESASMTKTEDLAWKIGRLEKDFDHISDKVDCMDNVIDGLSTDVRKLQDAQLLHPQEVKNIATKVIEEFQKTKSAKFQQFAPYFTAILGFAAAMIAVYYKAK